MADLTETDLEHLRRCIALEAAERGDAPFGSVLVSGDGEVLAERQNEMYTTGDRTAHPELALAIWASRHLSLEECAAATMYTSGEHCTMCAAAHVWAGIGRLVFVLSSEMIGELREPGRTSIAIRSREVIERSNVDVQVEGPVEELAEELAVIFRRV